MAEQWKQIEGHFLKIKNAMSDCWPVGNETDLLTVYLSLALLYSLYKDVCDEVYYQVLLQSAILVKNNLLGFVANSTAPTYKESFSTYIILFVNMIGFSVHLI